MAERVCPWWLGYFLISPIRRLLQHPRAILQPYVKEGMTVLEPGPGMGFFTLELARMVGASGKVVAVDMQPRMLQTLKRRLRKRGFLSRVDVRLAKPESMDLGGFVNQVDFLLAFAIVHEFPDAGKFFGEASATMKSGASLLLAEPRGHVDDAQFSAELEAAARVGLHKVESPAIPRSLAAVLRKT